MTTRVLYHFEMTYPWPPGRDEGEVELDVDDLPPFAKRTIAAEGLDAIAKQVFEWTSFGATLYWSVTPR